MDGRELWAALRGVTERTIAIADDITVALVANRKAEISDTCFDRSTEYLSDGEASQLLGGLRNVGFRTRYYDGELELIAHGLADPHLGTTSPHLIVYNLAQAGRDAARKSLVPAFCALRGIATCNSNAYAVSLARNKSHVHAILAKAGLPVPPSWSYSAGRGWLLGDAPPRGMRLIAKAQHESASIGLNMSSVGFRDDAFDLMLASRSTELQQPVIVQSFIEGGEAEAPVVRIGGRVGVVGSAFITLGGDRSLGARILDYETVAHDAYDYDAPSSEDADVVREIERVSSATYDVLGLAGFARVDFRVDAQRRVHVIDVATSPHLVTHSGYASVFARAGWSHDEMLACMIGVNAASLGWLQPSDHTWMSDISKPRPIDHHGS